MVPTHRFSGGGSRKAILPPLLTVDPLGEALVEGRRSLIDSVPIVVIELQVFDSIGVLASAENGDQIGLDKDALQVIKPAIAEPPQSRFVLQVNVPQATRQSCVN